jgi:hypothetical protein
VVNLIVVDEPARAGAAIHDALRVLTPNGVACVRRGASVLSEKSVHKVCRPSSGCRPRTRSR